MQRKYSLDQIYGQPGGKLYDDHLIEKLVEVSKNKTEEKEYIGQIIILGRLHCLLQSYSVSLLFQIYKTVSISKM